MQTKCFFRAASGTDWELTIEHEENQYCPRFLSEDEKGWIQDLSTDEGWESLPEMTQKLKVEIVDSATDVGD